MLTIAALIVTHAQLFILLAISLAALAIAFTLWRWLRLLRSRKTVSVIALVDNLKQKKQWGEARREVDIALQRDPTNVDLLELRNQIERSERAQLFEEQLQRIKQLTNVKEWSEARRELDLALREYPASADLLELRDEIQVQGFNARLQRIEHLTRSKKWNEARGELDVAFREYPAFVDSLANTTPGVLPKDALELSHRVLNPLRNQIEHGEMAEAIEKAAELGDWARAADLVSSAITSFPGEPVFARLQMRIDEKRRRIASLQESFHSLVAIGEFESAGHLLEELRSEHPSTWRDLCDELNQTFARWREEALRIASKVADLVRNDQSDQARELLEIALQREVARQGRETYVRLATFHTLYEAEEALVEAAWYPFSRSAHHDYAFYYFEHFRKAPGWFLIEALHHERLTAQDQFERATQVPPVLSMDNVHFTLTAPGLIVPAKACEIRFWIHIEEQRTKVLELAKPAHHPYGSDLMVKSEGPFPLQRGARLSVRIKVEGIGCADDHKWVIWTGEIGSTTFVLTVPSNASEGTRVGTASIRLNGCQIAKMSFVLMVGATERETSLIPSKTTYHRKAFASYASEDRSDVLVRVQGMEATGVKVFLDVVDLRSAQYWESELVKRISEADVFYLFWCRHALASEWVTKEWQWAFDTKGLDFIDPIPLEGPEFAPPPSELAAKHFNDPLLAFIAAAGGGHSRI